MINRAKQQTREEFINTAKAKFMEEYFELNQSIKGLTNKKGEEYDAIVKRIEKIENHMECLKELMNMMNNEQI